ncbi:MAG: membrane or secreted protein [Flavobacteriales bacterium]|nr:membrane or secreted protein [Flavobacteriales bacterium]
MSFLPVFLITIGFLVFVFAGIGIKILLKKNGKFSGTCASQSPFLNTEGETCGLCGASPEEKCKNEDA